MSTQVSRLTTKSLFQQQSIQSRFEKLLGKKSQGFISSVLQVVNSNNLLKKADPQTVLNAAATAAALDLPVNQSLGFAWIVPYKGQASFQLGWKGYVQLAQRTGQYERINVTEVYENQFKSFNALTEDLEADFGVDPEGKVVGYAAYFRMINGFEKLVYWPMKKVTEHGKRFSKSFNNGPWKSDFDSMAKKTVLKNTLSKWGIMSIEMQTAHVADQSVQKEEGNYTYPDNEPETIEIQSNEEKPERLKVRMLSAITDSMDKEKFKSKFGPEVTAMDNEQTTNIFFNFLNDDNE